MTILLPLAIFVVALVLEALFSGYETGFVSTNPIRIRHLAEEEKDPRAVRLLGYMQNPDRFLTTLLIGTNLMVVTGTLVVTMQVARFFSEDMAHLISTLILAPIILIFAEIIPKSVFRIHPNRLSLALAPVVRVFYVVFTPVAAPVTWLTRGLLRAIGSDKMHVSSLVSSSEDVRLLVDEGVDHGTIEPEEQEMIHSVIDLQTTAVTEIMAPRIDIKALPDTATRTELVALFADTGLTRIPIYRQTIDEIVGVVNAYSILMDDDPENEDITRHIKEVMHVPDTIKVDDLFTALKDAKQHMAIVTDEYGGTDGLVTIEDILEEIFGEIQDEYDKEESPINKVGPNAYVVDARAPLEDLAEAIGVPIDDEDVETVAGWVMHVAGYIPAQGEVIAHGAFRMTVLVGGPNHIASIRLEIADDRGKGHEEEERA